MYHQVAYSFTPISTSLLLEVQGHTCTVIVAFITLRHVTVQFEATYQNLPSLFRLLYGSLVREIRSGGFSMDGSSGHSEG